MHRDGCFFRGFFISGANTDSFHLFGPPRPGPELGSHIANADRSLYAVSRICTAGIFICIRMGRRIAVDDVRLQGKDPGGGQAGKPQTRKAASSCCYKALGKASLPHKFFPPYLLIDHFLSLFHLLWDYLQRVFMIRVSWSLVKDSSRA